jgi:tetratricopeptide (TPR) repeat protein
LAQANDINDSLYNVLDTARAEVRVNTLNELSKTLINSDPQKALDHTREALDLSIKLNYKRGIASCYNNLGVLYKNQGIFDKALDYYIKSLEINELIQNTNNIALTKANIGNIYSLKKDHNKAIEYFTDAYLILKDADEKHLLIGVLNNMGNAYLAMGNQDNALKYFTQAVDLYEELGQKSEAFDPLNSLGNIYFYRGEFDKAIDYYSLSLLIEKEKNNKFGQAYAHNNIGVAYHNKKSYAEAERHENLALNLAHEINAQTLLKDIYKALSETYYEQNRVNEAYQARLLYDQTKDLLYNEESSRKLARIEVAFELQQHEKEIEIAKKENAISQLEDKNNKTYILVFIMGSMLLLASLFIFISLRKKRKK